MDTQNSPTEQNERLMRKKVNISDDTYLEAIKFLTCPEWSQNRFVSRQIDGIAQRNISRLPKMVLDCAAMYYINRDSALPVNKLDKYAIVSFDAVLRKRQSTQYFKNRGFTLSAPGIPAKTVLLNAQAVFDNWTRSDDSNVNVCIHGTVKDEIPLSFEEKLCPWFQKLNEAYKAAFSKAMEFRKPVLYYAQFNPALNECSWDYLAQFLKLVYHPISYAKDVKMFAVNQNFIDALECNIVDNERRYIHCEAFSLLIYHIDPGYNDLPMSLKWLPQNVHAEKIHLPWILDTSESFGLITNFLFDPFGAKQCASEMVTIQLIDATAFLNILIEKFHQIPFVEDGIPTTEFSSYRPAHMGPNLIDREVDSEGADALHVIINGPNRMRISFRSRNYIYDICHVRIYSI
ncbi:hypothetical protein DdX_16342 [Ditylenchus destructor]|uniref:Uncharacterized protein n=1 Tax=Ditylenchus destructor TaxID=166010 RepID=A0AAD4MTA9_9BILA|nr:hypothetical protein DdX_16342 [Ditylenchus destructor]